MVYRRALSGICAALVLTGGLTSGCTDTNTPAQGLRQTALSGGARIQFDLEERPFPNIPFPNDLATRPDPTSPTGLRVNISYRGGSKAEEKVRREVNKYTGFGVFSPITVSFDRPLDVRRIVERHQEPAPDFSDDVAYVVDIDPDSPEYGKLHLIDFGRGNFPVTMQRPDRYFDNDPRRQGTNLLFESVQERDLNGNGKLDPIEDTDDDGVWDRPNTLDPGADPLAFGQMLEFYERETNTLIIRTVSPLRPGTRYAVVLTGALRDEDGLPIDSPFDAINHTRQTDVLRPLKEILPEQLPDRFKADLKGVRFAWSFTTHVPTFDLEQLRAGLYGHGPLKRLKDEYPPQFKLLHRVKREEEGEPMTFDINALGPLLGPILTQAVGGGGDALLDSMKNVDYIVSGSYMSPLLIHDTDGLADPLSAAKEDEDGRLLIDDLNRQDDDEVFDLNAATGEGTIKPGEVTFSCAVPKETPTQKAPFPTIIYTHAISSTRMEMLAFIGAMAKFGFATCTIDNMGHGIAIPDEYKSLLDRVAPAQGFPGLPTLINHHRARDVNNDGVPDAGVDHFTSDTLHTRDMLRQTTVDQLQLVRILRNFDGVKRFPDSVDMDDPYVRARLPFVASWDQNGDGQSELLGDFNGDGVPDFGGDRTYVAWGTSQGAIQSSLLAGIEPLVRAVSTNAGGGGLGDILARTSISQVRIGSLLRIFGPILVGTRGQSGKTTLSWVLPDALDDVRIPFATIEGLEDGDRVVLRNPKRETNPYVPEDERVSVGHVRDGKFRLTIAADALKATGRRAKLGLNPKFSMLEEGMGCKATRKCDDNTFCGEEEYCTQDAVCAPLNQCFDAFDPSRADDPETRAHIAADPTELGDALRIEVYDSEGKLKREVTTFEQHVLYQNILYPKGAPLAALTEGWGLRRQTPKFRRLAGIAQVLLEPADPAVWANHYTKYPLKFPYEPHHKLGATNALVVGTLGDQTVPISAGMAIARAAGGLDVMNMDERFGMTPNQFLIHNYVYEGIYWLDRFPDYPGMLFDPDNLDATSWRSTRDGRASPEATEPLRSTIDSPYWDGKIALRLPYLDERGAHTFNVPQPGASFDINTFMANQVGWYLATGGREVRDDLCMEKDLSMKDCAFYDPNTFRIDLPE